MPLSNSGEGSATAFARFGADFKNFGAGGPTISEGSGAVETTVLTGTGAADPTAFTRFGAGEAAAFVRFGAGKATLFTSLGGGATVLINFGDGDGAGFTNSVDDLCRSVPESAFDRKSLAGLGVPVGGFKLLLGAEPE